MREAWDEARGYCQGKLDNGLEYEITQNGEKFFRIDVTVQAGQADDRKGLEGTAHLLEHLLSEYQNPAVAESYFFEFQKRGGTDNAITSLDTTTYTYIIPYSQDNVTYLLNFIRWTVFKPYFDEMQFHREKQVLIIEDGYYQDKNANNLDSIFRETIRKMQTSRYAFETEQSLENITLRDLQEFHADYYTGRNVRIDVSGPAQTPFIKDMIASHFSFIVPGQKNDRKTQYHYNSMEMRQEEPLNNVNFLLLFLCPQEELGDYPNLEKDKYKFLASYIELALKEKWRGTSDRLVYTPFCFMTDIYDLTMITIQSQVPPQHARTVMPHISGLIQNILANRIDDNLFTVAQAQCCANARSEEERAAMKDINESDLADCMKRLLKVKPSLIVLGPPSGIDSLDRFCTRLGLNPHAMRTTSDLAVEKIFEAPQI